LRGIYPRAIDKYARGKISQIGDVSGRLSPRRLFRDPSMITSGRKGD
jgi:hypothetical protein